MAPGRSLARISAALLGGLSGLSLAGCAPADPLDTKVEATDPVGFAMWETSIQSRLSSDQIETMGKALQEIKFHIMSAEGKSGHEAVDEALLAKINGQTLRQVIQEGLSWEMERARAEWSALDEALNKNGIAASRADFKVSVDYERYHEHQLERLQAAADEVALTKARMLANSGHLAGP